MQRFDVCRLGTVRAISCNSGYSITSSIMASDVDFELRNSFTTLIRASADLVLSHIPWNNSRQRVTWYNKRIGDSFGCERVLLGVLTDISVVYRPNIDRLSVDITVDCRSSMLSIDRVSIEYRLICGRTSVYRRLTVVRDSNESVSVMYRWTVGRVSVTYRSSIGTACSTLIRTSSLALFSLFNTGGVAAFKPLSQGLTRIWVKIAKQKNVKLQLNVCCRWHVKLVHTSPGKSVV